MLFLPSSVKLDSVYMNAAFDLLPTDLVRSILGYDGTIKYRHGKYMNQLLRSDFRYDVVRTVPRTIHRCLGDDEDTYEITNDATRTLWNVCVGTDVVRYIYSTDTQFHDTYIWYRE